MNGVRGRVKYIVFAFLAAVFYAVNIPFSKLLLERIDPTVMAALLYLGAGIGVGIMSLFMRGDRARYEKLGRSDLPYVIGMIALDIFAPILLMLGLKYGTSSSASLLGNFEIAATAVIALIFFKEAVSKRLWLAIALITLASAILSLNGTESLHFSVGSLFVLLAAVCWGFENNCTRRISSKSTYQIVVLKGIFSGLGSLMIAFIIGESPPFIVYAAAALVLGFVSYGLSIFLYVRAQSVLGAAKTSACYAAAPFVGAFLSFVFLRENLTPTFVIALAVMIAGTVLVVLDTLKNERQ